jgi:hypothetical protein
MAEAAFDGASDPRRRLKDSGEAKARSLLRAAGGCLAVAAAAIGALLAASAGGGAVQVSHIIDRTIVCRMAGQGFPDAVRFIGASARPYDVANDVSPQAGVGNNAGHGSSSVGVGVETGPVGGGISRTTTGELSLTRTTGTRCAKTKLRIALSSAGLKGGLTDQTGDYVRCDVPAKVVFRVRAVFKQRPTAFGIHPRAPDMERARGDMQAAYISVATLRGRKPIAFMSVHDASGKARIFGDPSRCARS